ncbi:MAG: thioredoxin domain-containing protein [Saprospiraceae bacterium]
MNQLQFESSPYLLQHAGNPVDWFAWKPEVLEKAKKENKPILLSIGYSSCHWCHVMERESFENPDIAAFMNEHFINIKVDREERPDVDAIYMEACQILTGGGGWPLNCFLLPDGRPFYAGTYYPPRPAHNRPSWLQVLQHMSNAWESQRDKVEEQANRLMGHIQRNDAPPIAQKPIASGLGEKIIEEMGARFDSVNGGFGGAPKFPSTMAIHYLLSWYWLEKNEAALEQALFSLDKMLAGGLYDQIGGGFSRYTVDAAWLVPHFEKMLYDNALLLTVLSEAVQLIQSNTDLKSRFSERLRRYTEVIHQSLQFIERELEDASGGFYSALDADSEGVEGKYYVWDKAEVEAILGDDAALFCAFYGVSESGNWEGKNILNRVFDWETFLLNNGLQSDEWEKDLKKNADRLQTERNKRVRPGLDDKVLLGWNALMNTAYSTAYAATGVSAYKEKAESNMKFMLAAFCMQGSSALWHTWKNGAAQYPAFLDDYAFLIHALLELYQITQNEQYLLDAEKYTKHVLSYFWDEEHGMFFFTGKEQSDVIVRKKDLYDSATPSGNSTMVLNLQRLALLRDHPDWSELATQMLEQVQASVLSYPLSFERWAKGLLQMEYGLNELVILGGNAFEKHEAILGVFIPNKIQMAAQNANEHPLMSGKDAPADAAIYVCKNFACLRPLFSVDEFKNTYAVRKEV